jgi:Holliday junction resolvasome RuvABC endonuclease subunit
MTRYVLGVDPSFNRTGWCLLEQANSRPRMIASGVIVPKGAGRPTQLLSIKQQFEGVLSRWPAAEAYFERPGAWQRKGGTRRETVEAMSMSRAVMVVTCAERGLPVIEVELHVLRRGMLGRVNAGAEDVLQLLRQEGFEVPCRPHGAPDMDIANALVVAIYGLSWSRSAGPGEAFPE